MGDDVKETFYTIRGPGREKCGEKEAAIVADFMPVFNVDWDGSDRWQHYCHTSADDRRSCCRNAAESKDKMKKAFRALFQLVVWDKLAAGSKTLGENLRRCSKVSFLVHVHRTLPQAMRAWVVRGVDGGEDTSEERVDDNDEVKKRKRKMKAIRF